MASLVERTVATDRVAGIIQLVRRRWRLRHVLFGLGVVLALTVATLWIAAMAMERAGFSEASITWARVVVSLVTIAVGLRWIAWPIVRRLADGRVALYAEERIPSLDGALMSAVEATSETALPEYRGSGLTHGLVDDAVRRLRPHGNGIAVEAPGIRRAGLVLAGVALFGFGAFMLGPDYLRYGAALIATPWKKASEVAPYSISVEPGNATVPKGADFQITANLNGFSSELVEVVTRRGANTEWERIPMGLGVDTARFAARLFDLDADVEYYVESSGVRSGVFKLTVKNLPTVRKIDLELRFPSYTGLEVERIDDGGDIAAVRGTRVRVSVRATMPVKAGRLVLEGDSAIAMQRANDSTLVGELVVREDGFYRVELTAEDGTKVAGSVEYVVDALDDMPPTIAIRKPGRDMRPTNVEEVFVEVGATDDFGVGKVELVYSVNGEAEKTIVLNDSTASRSKDFIAGHTFFLEELGLKAGDVVSYYARATDGTGAREGQKAATDIYFMTIRPFGRDYRQNQQGGGGGGGGGGGQQDPGALTQQQRDIVAATFKAERDKEKTPATTFRENVTTIHLGQGRLREQVDELATRMNRPVVAQADTLFKVIADLLKKASEEMKSAEEQLSERDTKDALPPEQRALQALERAEAVYRDVQVSMGGGGGGGGGGQQQSNAEDLADLFELETDKMRNQYEQVQRGEQQQAQQQVDETLEKLKQLAARQQQENERARQRAQSMQQPGGGSGGGGGQRQLADQADSLARQLERLGREQQNQQMTESARRLQEAANEMRRAASQQGQGSASGSALDQIENARRLLEESRQTGQTGSIEDAARRAQQLAEQQREVSRDVQDLASAGASRSEREQRLDERKTSMAGEVQQLQEDIERMARDMARDRPEPARDLREAARGMREGRLRDKIQFSRGVMRQGAADYVRNFEQGIGDDLDSLKARLERANASSSGGGQRNAQGTLDRARDLVRGLSSIDDRMRDRENQAGSQQGQRGQQQGQAGQQQNQSGQQQGQQQGQGQQGQEKQGQGQQGQQGQGQQGQAQQGQQGQQGQGQQGQGQQGQGQQGQGQQGQGRQGQGQQGQGQGQGEGQGQGQRGLDPAGGGRSGSPTERSGGGAQGGGVSGVYTGEDARQFGRELRSQREAAEQLRRELQGQGRNVEELNDLIDQLRAIEGARAFNDPDELAKLRSSVVQGFKEFEFSLRRQMVGAEADRPALGGNENVPAGYRDMVNEYFKSLSKKPAATPPATPKKPGSPQ